MMTYRDHLHPEERADLARIERILRVEYLEGLHIERQRLRNRGLKRLRQARINSTK